MYQGLVIEPQVGLVPIGRDLHSGLWEFAHPRTGEIPTRGADGKLVLTEKTCLVFVLIPGGTVWMGAQADDPSHPNYDPHAVGAESPEHLVSVVAFFVSKYEMTQGQWLLCTGENPSRFDPAAYPGHTLLHPVENVSYEDCRRILSRLDLALPTEAQWEYAARAGTETPWWTGADMQSLKDFANIGNWHGGYNDTAPVGRFRPNGFGLHGTIGNVWEWCLDWYKSYDQPVRVGDGLRLGPEQLGARLRVIRGGSFYVTAFYARSASRIESTPENRNYDLGLRPARACH
jgi:formylglycine-generating enzyme required for sulfatase activity